MFLIVDLSQIFSLLAVENDRTGVQKVSYDNVSIKWPGITNTVFTVFKIQRRFIAVVLFSAYLN